MRASDQELPLLGDGDDFSFTSDGSVDFRSRPALRARSGGWAACTFIIGYEIIERLAYYGITANLVLYIKNELHEGSASASEIVNSWSGATTLLPIVGAFLADAYLGRFWTVAYSSAFYVLGFILLTLSASLSALRPATCSSSSSCLKATSFQLAFFYISLYSIAIGTAGVKPCLEAFGADQFDEDDPIERKNKSSFFSWWYFGIASGALLGFTVIVYIEDNATSGLGYGILALLITLASVVFLAGIPFYRHMIPCGSSLVGMLRVFVAAAKKWSLEVPQDHSLLYEVEEAALPMGRKKLAHTTGLRCLDKAATMCLPTSEGGGYHEHKNISSNDSPDMRNGVVDPWRLCTITQVEEVKLIARILPLWVTTIIFALVLAQSTTFFVQQAATMDRNVGSIFVIPSGSILAFSSLAIILMLPIYGRVVVPFARWFTGYHQGLTLLQRIGVGYFLSIVCMVTAALVERRRLKVVEEYGLLDDSSATIPMSVFWLAPQYLIFGTADVFTLVGEQEFFYDQVPDSLRSLGMSLYLISGGLASYLSNALISAIDVVTSRGGNQGWFVDNLNRCHLDYYYWFLAVLFTLNFLIYLALSWRYTYKLVEKKRQHFNAC